MAIFENEELIDGRFRVQYLIKRNSYCETYKVKNKYGASLFLKLYVLDKTPDVLKHVRKEMGPVCISTIGHALPLRSKYFLEIKYHGHIELESVGSCEYIVTPFINGELLTDKIFRHGQLPVGEAIRIYKEILLGLKYLHHKKRPLIHNDITPRNIMLTDDGEVKIIDLGHLSHPKSMSEALHIDPEDLDMWYHGNETIVNIFNEKTDIFSATAVFYAMLFGSAPWNPPPTDGTRNDKYKVIFKLRAAQWTLDFSGTPLKEKYREILRKGLDLNLKTRYKSVDEVLKDLDKPDNYQQPIDMPRDPDDVKEEKPEPAPKGFAAIAGMGELKKTLKDRVMFVLQNKKKAAQYKLAPPNGMLLYGPPGCGKTFFAEKFAEECGYHFIMTRMSNIGSTLVHGTEENIAKLFKEAEENAPTVLCFDEFDAFVPARTTYEGRNQSGEVNEFLSHLNNCGQRGVFVVATTNRPDMIDPAILRTGRIDRQIFVPMPDEEARQELFKTHLKGRPCQEIDIKALASKTSGYIASDIAYICNEAAIIAALNDKLISQESVEMVLSTLHPSIRPEAIKMYDEIREKMEGINRKNTIKKIGFV